MKVTKEYLRQLIVESLEESKEQQLDEISGKSMGALLSVAMALSSVAKGETKPSDVPPGFDPVVWSQLLQASRDVKKGPQVDPSSLKTGDEETVASRTPNKDKIKNILQSGNQESIKKLKMAAKKAGIEVLSSEMPEEKAAKVIAAMGT